MSEGLEWQILRSLDRVDWDDDFEVDPTTAWHEAAHCVVGLLTGRRPFFLYCNRSQGFDGPLGGIIWRLPTDVQFDLEHILAGELGQSLHSHFMYRPYPHELIEAAAWVRAGVISDHDRMKVIAYLVGLYGEDDLAIADAYRAAEDRTIAMLERRDVRNAIKTIAEFLTKMRRLSGETAMELASIFIEPAPPIPERTTLQ